MEKIIVRLHLEDAAVAGIDFSNLKDDISAELAAFSEKVEGSFSLNELPIPEGGQGFGGFEWIVNLLLDPDMAKTYAPMLIRALNSIVQSIIKKQKNQDEKNQESKTGQEKEAPPLLRILAFGKELLLPATIIAIKEFLESIGAE